MRISELNRLYVAAHYLKAESIKKVIAGYLACRVYISSEMTSINWSPISSNGMTEEKYNKYRDTYPFLNWSSSFLSMIQICYCVEWWIINCIKNHDQIIFWSAVLSHLQSWCSTALPDVSAILSQYPMNRSSGTTSLSSLPSASTSAQSCPCQCSKHDLSKPPLLLGYTEVRI